MFTNAVFPLDDPDLSNSWSTAAPLSINIWASSKSFSEQAFINGVRPLGFGVSMFNNNKELEILIIRYLY